MSTVPPSSRTRTASRVIAIILVVVGAVVLTGTAARAAGSTVVSGLVRSDEQSVSTTGVEALDIEIGGAALDIDFAEVDEALLSVEGTAAQRFELAREGDTLVVRTSERRWWSSWLVGFGGLSQATLTLPEELQDAGLDAALTIGGGALRVDAAFDSIDLEVGAGRMQVRGSADDVELDLAAGQAVLRLADVESAQLDVSAGALEATFLGEAPAETMLAVSAGSADLVLPAGVYDVRSDVSSGRLVNDLDTRAGADSIVDVEVSAGSASLRSATRG